MIKYRMLFSPNVFGCGDPFVGEPVDSQELAEGQLNVIANYTLLLHEQDLMADHSNYGCVERMDDDGDWVDVDEDDL